MSTNLIKTTVSEGLLLINTKDSVVGELHYGRDFGTDTYSKLRTHDELDALNGIEDNSNVVIIKRIEFNESFGGNEEETLASVIEDFAEVAYELKYTKVAILVSKETETLFNNMGFKTQTNINSINQLLMTKVVH